MMLSTLEHTQLKAKLFRGLADSTRLIILESLRGGEKTVTEIVEETKRSQSNVSNHLNCLLGCGLVQNRRDGKTIRYSLADVEVSEILEHGDNMLNKVAERVQQCVRYND